MSMAVARKVAAASAAVTAEEEVEEFLNECWRDIIGVKANGRVSEERVQSACVFVLL